jgi:hypothetical protein
MKQRQQGTTAYPIPFLMVSSTDHVTAVTGITPTVTLSKNGGAFGAAAGAVSEIGSGWYALAGNATDRATVGELALHATGTGADPFDTAYTIVPWDPFDAVRLGLTALPNAAAEAAGGLYTRGTGAGQINQPANGQIDTNTAAMTAGVITATVVADGAIDAGALASDAITAAKIATGAITSAKFAVGAIDAAAIAADAIGASELAADAVAEIQSGLSLVIRQNTAQAGTSTTITLDASASATNDLYKGLLVRILSGTGAGQTRAITGYVGATKVATVHVAWVTAPSSDSVFQLLPFPEVAQAPDNFAATIISAAGVVDGNVVQISGDSTAADNLESYTDGTTPIPANVTQISGDATAADNAEAAFDGAGYNVGAGQIVAASVTGAVGSVGSGGIAAASFAAGAITAAAIATDAIGASELAADAVTKIQNGLSTAAALTTVGNNITSVKTVTDKLNTALEDDGAAGYQFTTVALENAPAGGGGGSGDGDYARTIRLQRSSGERLPNRRVTAYDSGMTAIQAFDTTNSEGEVVFNLNAGTFFILVGSTAADVALAAQTLTVSASGTTTYTIAAASSTPSSEIL